MNVVYLWGKKETQKMIHNLKINEDGNLTFRVITQIGTADCIVRVNELDKDGRPKLEAKNYIILGVAYDETQNMHYLAAAKIANMIEDICDNNGWNLWIY